MASANPIVIIGGWLSAPDDYRVTARTLAAPPYRRTVYICEVGRGLWASLRDPDFSPVLRVLAATVGRAIQETGAERVDLIGHSAGGRVARAYLGHEPLGGQVYDGQRHVARLITLGTAHRTHEIWVAQFAALLNERYPGAFYPHISYRSVAGESVRGRLFGSLEEILAYQSYRVSFGNGDQLGDGVVPTACCYLAGADNLVLRGARHAPYNAPRTWYGASEIVPYWFEE